MFEHRFQRHLIMTDYPNLSPARMVENIIINDGGRFDFALGEEEIIGDYHKYKLKKFVEDGKTHIQNTYDIYYFNDRIPEKASIKYLEELEIIQEALFAPFEEFNKNAPVYLSEGVYGLSSLYSMQPLPPPSTRSINNQSEEFITKVSSRIPMGRLAKSDEYKGTLLWMLSDASSYLNGAIVPVDGGRTAW